MGFPIDRLRRDSVSQVPDSKRASPSATTAKKVPFPAPLIQGTGLRDRQISPIKGVTELSKQISKEWNALAPEELAEKIIELEGRVARLPAETFGLEKIIKQAEHLHFQFVFPVVLEMSTAPAKASVPVSFARTIYNVANRVFKTQSVQPLHELSSTQRQEVLRYVSGRDL